MSGPGPAQPQHGQHDGQKHQSRSQVGLDENQERGHRGKNENHKEPAQIQLTTLRRPISGQRHDDGDLGKFGRLKLKRSHIEPPLRPFVHRTQRAEHRQQGHHSGGVDEYGTVHEHAIVDTHHGKHHADAEHHEQHLLLHK